MSTRKQRAEDAHYAISPFDIYSIPDNAVVCLYGRRGSGKSTMLRHLLWSKRHIPHGLVCSATERATGDLQRHVPSAYIRTEYDDEITRAVMKYQRKLCERNGGKEHTPPAFLVYDDTMFDRRFPASPETRRLFMNGRHYNIFTMITSQYAMDLPPAMRANIDFVIMFNEPTKQNRIKLYNNFGGIFPSFEHFERVFLAATKNYHCLVISNVSQSHDVDSVVFHYRAPPHMPSVCDWVRGVLGRGWRTCEVLVHCARSQAGKRGRRTVRKLRCPLVQFCLPSPAHLLLSGTVRTTRSRLILSFRCPNVLPRSLLSVRL